MNENEIDVNWNDLQLFLVVAREGGLSSASKITNKSPATLGRRMLGLERALAKSLFNRHGRGYQLTNDGKVLLNEMSEIESRIGALTSKEVKPVVKVSAGTWTNLFLVKNVDRILEACPDILLRLISTEKILDINHREVVIGFRNERPIEDSLVCRKISKVEFAAYSVPNAPNQWIRVLADTPSSRWVTQNVKDSIFCEVMAPRDSLDLALAGQGITILPTFIGDSCQQLIRNGSVIEELNHDQWLVTHQDDRYLPEVRKLISTFVKLFGAM